MTPPRDGAGIVQATPSPTVPRNPQILLPETPGSPTPPPRPPRRFLAGAASRVRLCVLLDVLAALVAWYAVGWAGVSEGGPQGAAMMFALGLSVVIANWTAPRSRLGMLRIGEVRQVTTLAVMTGVVVAVMGSVTTGGVSWAGLVVGVLLAFGLLTMSAGARRSLLARARRSDGALHRVLIIGDDAEAAEILRLFDEHPSMGVDVVGRAGGAVLGDPRLDSVPWCGELQDLDAIVAATEVSSAFIAAGDHSVATLNRTVRTLVQSGVDVQLSNGLRGLGHRRLALSSLALEPLLHVRARSRSSVPAVAKRTLDVVVSSTLLVIAAPLMAVSAAVVKLQDGGPALFRQKRVGQGGRQFTMLKFRSMQNDAESRLQDLHDGNERDGGPLFKMQDDPRVTPVGRLLRASSIDELPQLINVLRGDMSLVGPRPALPTEVAEFTARLRGRCQVRPGITGLWQVEARDNPSFWSYERLDLFYVENWTFVMDITILLATVPVVLGRGLAAVSDGLTNARTAKEVRLLRRGA